MTMPNDELLLNEIYDLVNAVNHAPNEDGSIVRACEISADFDQKIFALFEREKKAAVREVLGEISDLMPEHIAIGSTANKIYNHLEKVRDRYKLNEEVE